MTEVLSAQGLRKTFGATVALDGVDLNLRAGEVHALVGENGAGKSTLIHVLGGVTTPDAGALSLDGRAYVPGGPWEAQARGVAVVHQELSLCPHLTVAENIMLGREPSRFGFVRESELLTLASAALVAAAGASRASKLPLSARACELPLADQQLVEIARVLTDESVRVLILDEPTSSLGRDEVRVLHERIRALRLRGLAVLYISHFLDEVREIADRYTVLRDGRRVATGEVRGVTSQELVTMMTGRDGAEHVQETKRAPGEVVLACEGLAGSYRPKSASLELRRGEILGIAGIVGAGRTELLRVLFGLDPLERGTLRAFDRLGAASPHQRIAQGFGMLSEDRKGEGLALAMSVADNLSLSSLPTWVRSSWQRAMALRWVDRLGIRCGDIGDPVINLSGGNQQKVAFGRLMQQDAQILLLDQPTRGIDVAAKAEIHRLVLGLAASGKAILLVSDDLAELSLVCDRIAVMHRGVLGPARPASACTAASLLAEAVGAPTEHAA